MTLQLPPFRPALRFAAEPPKSPATQAKLETYSYSEAPEARKQRHIQEMADLLADLNANLDALTPVWPPKRNVNSPNKDIQATLKHPSGRRFDVILYFDYENDKRLACMEIRGTANGMMLGTPDPHPPGRNLYSEKIRYNNWDKNPGVEYVSSLQPLGTGRQVGGEYFWDTAQIQPAANFADKLLKKLTAPGVEIEDYDNSGVPTLSGWDPKS